MTTFSIFLVLLSALLHALWNYIIKGSHGGAAFVWLFAVMESILYIPLLLIFISDEDLAIDLTGVGFIFGSAVLHVVYFLLLDKGYQVGDLSIVYPLARGIGPLISTIAAIAFLSERPTALALFGGLLVCGGVFWLTGDPRKLRSSDALPGVGFAFLCGLSIAAYTIWDSYAVSRLLLPPLLYQWGLGVFRVMILTPYAIKNQDVVRLVWRDDKWKALIVGVMGSLSYLLILIALVVSPVSYVAPMRVISTLIGVALGTRLLKEGNAFQRLSAAGAMVLGVIALSLG